MNILLWIIQVLLTLVFLFSGGMKLAIPADQLQAQAPGIGPNNHQVLADIDRFRSWIVAKQLQAAPTREGSLE